LGVVRAIRTTGAGVMSDDPLDRIGALAMVQQALFARFSEAYNSLHADGADLRIDVLAEIRKTPTS
jgi:hypothetical protein